MSRKYSKYWLAGAAMLTILHVTARDVFAAEATLSAGISQEYVGYWINEDIKTEGITAIEITVKDGKTICQNIWGACKPYECDWVEMGSRLSAIQEVKKLKIISSDSVGKETLRLSVIGENRLKVDAMREYTDWRPTQKHEYFYRRSSWSRMHVLEASDHKVKVLGYDAKTLDRSFDSVNIRWRDYVAYMEPGLRGAMAKTDKDLANHRFWAVYYVPKGDLSYQKWVADSNRRKIVFGAKLWIFVDQDTGISFASLIDGPPSEAPVFQ